ncbi:unnamed protein product [Cylicostephanus goldi]|uniref:Uncharacterized protein n=1 Tax=Cylicostephanus goldi TaxID=71465 RepID=A0A3P7M043_CYLGO|nr:unnamed protein product [Cylicostephanus goldi]
MFGVSGYDGDDLGSTSTTAGLPPTKTVITVGIVKSEFEQGDTICHVLGDPEDTNKVCRVITYSSVSGLRVPNVLYGILSFHVRELANDLELRAFCFKAKIARLNFDKNIPSRLCFGMEPGSCGAAGPPADYIFGSGVKVGFSNLHVGWGCKSFVGNECGVYFHYLIRNGHLCTTVDDEHYALIM